MKSEPIICFLNEMLISHHSTLSERVNPISIWTCKSNFNRWLISTQMWWRGSWTLVLLLLGLIRLLALVVYVPGVFYVLRPQLVHLPGMMQIDVDHEMSDAGELLACWGKEISWNYMYISLEDIERNHYTYSLVGSTCNILYTKTALDRRPRQHSGGVFEGGARGHSLSRSTNCCHKRGISTCGGGEAIQVRRHNRHQSPWQRFWPH